MLIGTLPSLHRLPLLQRMINHPGIGGVRYNVGARTALSPHDVLTQLADIARDAGKQLWIDLKGRQLRITRWADPTYGDIELNREVVVRGPARIHFRGAEWSNVVATRGNQVFVDPDPRSALGAGQAVNIIGDHVEIGGDYLTTEDRAYIQAAAAAGIDDFMLSFVERASDIDEVLRINPRARCVLKIESPAGLAFVGHEFARLTHPHCRLMAARDDLLTNIGANKARILPALSLIIARDPTAILASHLFMGLRQGDSPSMADLSDLRLMSQLGYRHFMLSDGISHHAFDPAMQAWQDFLAVFPETSPTQ